MHVIIMLHEEAPTAYKLQIIDDDLYRCMQYLYVNVTFILICCHGTDCIWLLHPVPFCDYDCLNTL